ncbi:nucleoside phosphorylase [uncultured Sphaerochaeta sp.]|uniref:nucleoside phosphorylase n=1 Tax=uncultured Sphaerochaeta sp. TaxID=886478 RepID=UPI0029C9CAD3|nr:nucleoside phosphorylase [uncultured Sphaerochaeta sp.]
MALNKSEVTMNKKQYHIQLDVGDIGEYVLLPGDPARSDRVAKYLDSPQLVASHREHRTFTGYYKGIKISVTSTGMGCPSTAIAAEELINIGAKTLIRIGSSAAIAPQVKIGDLLVSTGAMKNEGTSKFYVPDSFPAVPDFAFTNVLIETANEFVADKDIAVYTGISSTDDAFYGETPEFIKKLQDLKIQNIEMEASALFTIGHVRDVATACICGTSGNLTTGEVIYTTENTKLIEAWDLEIKVVLETIYRYHSAKLAAGVGKD